MNLNPFLTDVFSAYTTQCNPLDERARIEAALTDARARCAELEAALAQHSVTDEDIQKFLINAEELLGGHASEHVLMNMLVARFGGGAEKPKRGRKKNIAADSLGQEGTPAASKVTQEEKDLIASVMTLEPMSSTEIAHATTTSTGDTWLASDVSKILKVMIAEGMVATEGEKRGKRYMLVATVA